MKTVALTLESLGLGTGTWHKLAGLFEDNKLTCSFLIATALQRHAGEISPTEWSLLLRTLNPLRNPAGVILLDHLGDYDVITIYYDDVVSSGAASK